MLLGDIDTALRFGSAFFLNFFSGMAFDILVIFDDRGENSLLFVFLQFHLKFKILNGLALNSLLGALCGVFVH